LHSHCTVFRALLRRSLLGLESLWSTQCFAFGVLDTVFGVADGTQCLSC